ncbi:McrB family protein [Deinococcus oregonensis]|uniref:McrB family protein n=1 Tax=Deinococcus oregonensis TaxID=1805970 RepID=A0ABV6B0X5_9DEIO
MTQPIAPWLPWETIKTNYEANKAEAPKVFDERLGVLATAPLLHLLTSTQANLEHLHLPTSGTGLRASLGQHQDSQQRVLWEAAAGLSPTTDRWGVKGIVKRWGASFREGLNLWLEIPHQQQGGVFRRALGDADTRQQVLDALLALPSAFSPQLSVGASIADRPELRREFPEIHALRTEHANPFNHTDISSNHRQLLTRLLNLYSDRPTNQTILTVKLWLPAAALQAPVTEVALLVRPMLEALDKLAELWTTLNLLSDSSGATQVESPSQVVQELHQLTRFTRNIILYGPPGTGKTYAVQQFLNSFLGDQTTGSAEPVDVGRLPRWQAIALTLYGSPEPLSVTAMLEEQPLARYEAVKGARTPYASVMTELVERGVDISDVPVSIKYKRSPTVFQKQPNRTWTLTADGRELVERTLLGQPTAEWSLSPEARSRFITFHPSFAYEEFVEGLRPETDEEGRLQYRVRPGQFKEICQDAEKELHEAAQAGRPPRKFLLVIDEINRANIAKVFGELMTLIEDGKRVDNAGGGLRVQLPYSGQPFGVPENLTILGTMNTADRSIALLDLALRRRFTFLEVLPDAEVIRQTSGTGGIVDGVDVARLLEALNARLRVMLDRDHQMGHSYLSDIQGGLDELHYRWYRKVIPLLQEYFYNDGEKLARVLGSVFVQLGERVGGVGGRLDYDILPLAGEPFKQALQALSTPSTTLSGAASS